MNNLAPKEPQRVKYIDITKARPGNWQYIDCDKFETQIRIDETRKWVEKRKRERAREKLRKEAFWAVILSTLAIRTIGLVVLLGSLALSLYLHTAYPIFGLGWVAVLFIVCPGHNNVGKEMDEYIKRRKKNEHSDMD